MSEAQSELYGDMAEDIDKINRPKKTLKGLVEWNIDRILGNYHIENEPLRQDLVEWTNTFVKNSRSYYPKV